jgi:hypothetical protein
MPRVSTEENSGSLSSASAPTKDDKLPISLHVEQQLLVLKPFGSKNWQPVRPTALGRWRIRGSLSESSARRRAAAPVAWLAPPPMFPLQVHRTSELVSQVERDPACAAVITVGTPDPIPDSRLHSGKPSADMFPRSGVRVYLLMQTCVDLVPTCRDRQVDFASEATPSASCFLHLGFTQGT